MALIEPGKKKRGILTPRENMGLDEGPSTRESTNRMGKSPEATPLGLPQTPTAEIETPKEVDRIGEGPNKKMKVKKKEPGVGSYQA